MSILSGKVAVITGASSGFGEGIARRFAAEGAELVIAARGQQRLEQLAAELGATAVVCDISSYDDIKNLADAAVEKFGRLDIAVNSAGFEDACPFAELEAERVQKLVAVQFTGALHFIQHMANAMSEGGSIVSVSSLTAHLAAKGHAPYAGAKAGVEHASRIAAAEFGPQGVRINTVAPTLIETPMTSHLFQIPEVHAMLERDTPLGKVGSIDDVVEAVLWLASDASGFVTAENIKVCGGLGLRQMG